jgi:hypothetical protein
MTKFSLVPYSIRVRKKRSNQYIPLSGIPVHEPTSSADLLNFLQDYLTAVIPKRPHNPDEDEVLRVDSTKLVKRSICGRLKGGQRGYGSDLVDTKTGDIDYERKVFHAEIIPYYFLAAIPFNSDKGIIIFQKLKNLGIKDLFFNDFYSHFSSVFGSEYVLEIDPLVPKEMLKKYLKERVLKIRLIKQGFPRDTFDVDLDGFPDDEDTGEVEFVVKAGRKGSLPASFLNIFYQGIDKFLESSNEPVGSIIEVKNFEYDNVKVEVQVGKKIRTVDISNPDRLNYSEDISGIETDLQGHPKFDIIDELGRSFLQDISLDIFGGKIDV